MNDRANWSPDVKQKHTRIYYVTLGHCQVQKKSGSCELSLCGKLLMVQVFFNVKVLIGKL